MKSIFIVALVVFISIVALGDAETDPNYVVIKVQFDGKYQDILLQLRPDEAPIAVDNFRQYIDMDFYDGLTFHRVINNFMIQGGGYEPNGFMPETLDPILNDNDARLFENPSTLLNVRGSIAMGLSNYPPPNQSITDPNSATSQFYINLVRNAHLDPNNHSSGVGHVVFGHVLKGMDTVDEIANLQTDNNDKPSTTDVIIREMGYLYDVGYCNQYDKNGDCTFVDLVDYTDIAANWLLDGFKPLGLQDTIDWVERYNQSNKHDMAHGMVIDDANNIYVAGESRSTSESYNFVTIKYDAEGNELWREFYNGSADSVDKAMAIAQDGFGNIYVTGYSTNTSRDYTTVKYDADGNELWARHYDGSGSYDTAYAIAVDSDGFAYITGKSMGADSNYDCATVAYDPNGVQLWAKRYDGNASDSEDQGVDIALDHEGNILVTGSAEIYGSGMDYLTIKYSPDSTRQWIALYDGAYHNTDIANALAIDSMNNIYVTGSSEGEFHDTDMLTVKYDSDGTQLWIDRESGGGPSMDSGNDVAVDSRDYCIVTGRIYFGENSDVASNIGTLTYDPNSNFIWANTYNGPGNSTDLGVKLFIDDDDNVYVAGETVDPNESKNIIIIKYNSEGEGLGDTLYNHDSADLDDIPEAIVADSTGNVYVAGTSDGGFLSDNDIITLKINPADICVNDVYDQNDDCIFDLEDMKILMDVWLVDNLDFTVE